jgi:hypothetical protein
MFWVGLTYRLVRRTFLEFGIETCRCANQVLKLVAAQSSFAGQEAACYVARWPDAAAPASRLVSRSAAIWSSVIW